MIDLLVLSHLEMVGLIRLCLVSVKFLYMLRKTTRFLIEIDEYEVPMFRGYGGNHL